MYDTLGGQAKTLMFVHISPEMDAVGETLSTLKFAERVATIELGAAKLNKENGEVRELKEQVLLQQEKVMIALSILQGDDEYFHASFQIASLKAALARKEGESEPMRSTMSSPDIFRVKSGTISPVAGDIMGQRQPMEDVGNLEVSHQLFLF